MRQGECFGRALLIKDVSTIPTVVFAVCESESSTTSHTNVRVDPFRRLHGPCQLNVLSTVLRCLTYRTAINHAAGNRDARWEPEALALQIPVHFPNIIQLVSTFGGCGP